MTSTRAHAFHGLEIPLRVFAGARSLRIVHPPGQVIPAHRHDWPLLTLPTLGGYEEEWDDGSVFVGGPAVVLHPPGFCHANCIHGRGMETISIEFDPDWLQLRRLPLVLDRSFYWIGGKVSLAARKLMQAWTNPAQSEAALQEATAQFLANAIRQVAPPLPQWFDRAMSYVAREERQTAMDIARQLDMHPRWFAHAYRLAAGEGLQDTIRRRRVEDAVQLLRSTDEPIAEIAAGAGFCDQSHLNRSIRHFTGRTPAQIRAERQFLRSLITI